MKALVGTACKKKLLLFIILVFVKMIYVRRFPRFMDFVFAMSYEKEGKKNQTTRTPHKAVYNCIIHILILRRQRDFHSVPGINNNVKYTMRHYTQMVCAKSIYHIPTHIFMGIRRNKTGLE